MAPEVVEVVIVGRRIVDVICEMYELGYTELDIYDKINYGENNPQYSMAFIGQVIQDYFP